MSRERGFTLIELLVAMAIVAVIGVMALGGLNTVIQQQTLAEARAERWREIQFAMRIITQDLAQIHPRLTREEMGESRRESLLLGPGQLYTLELSRGGWSNPANLPRGTVLRVAYDWEEPDRLLVRYHWPVMDRTMQTFPVRTELLSGVEEMRITMIDRNNQPQIEWPPRDMTDAADALVARPRAVEFRLVLEDFGEIWRTVETSG